MSAKTEEGVQEAFEYLFDVLIGILPKNYRKISLVMNKELNNGQKR